LLILHWLQAFKLKAKLFMFSTYSAIGHVQYQMIDYVTYI
jgi:hypothetical protein